MNSLPRNPLPSDVMPPPPPEGLRARVLDRVAAHAPPPARPWWDHPRIRWAWAVAMALVLAGHLGLSLSPPRVPEPARPRPAALRQLETEPVLACCPGLVRRRTAGTSDPARQRLVEAILKGDVS